MTITTNRSSMKGRESARRPGSSHVEALASIVGGAVLGAYALLRRRWGSIAAGAGGGYLMYRGITELRRPLQGRVRKSFTIVKTADEIYGFMSEPSNWNRFLHAIRLEQEDDDRMRLRFGEPAGLDLSSRVIITDHRPADYIAWASDEKAFEHRGVIRFREAPGDRGTEVSVALEYKAPAGPLARGLASLVGWDPEQVVTESLRHLKQLMEAGELPTTAGQPVGERGVKGAAMRLLYREGPTEDATQQVRLAGD
jgi:uncharacterized membrane protein